MITNAQRARITIERTDRIDPSMRWRWSVHITAPFYGHDKGFTWTNKAAVRRAKRAARKLYSQHQSYIATRQEFEFELNG